MISSVNASSSRRAVRAAILVAAVATIAPSALAGDAALAEALFREGRQLLEQKRYDDACPKLAASQREDPATGTLLALALCYEEGGKTASAWAAYTEAATRAKREGQLERESAARGRAEQLAERLSRLTITLAPEAQGLAGVSVTREGAPVARAAWGMAVPVDPGTHRVEVSAPGHRSWSKSIEIREKQDQTVTVPALAPEPAHAPKTDERVPRAEPKSSSLRTIGLVTGGVGVVAVGLGSYFGLRASSLNERSKDDCDGNACGPAGKADRNDARSAGNVSTVAFIAGGALLATGVTLFVIGAPEERAPGVAVRGSPLGVSLRGVF